LYQLRRPLLAGTIAAILFSTGCNWLSLAANAFTYPTLRSGEAGNVVATDSIVYATQGAAGLSWLDSHSGETIGTLPPPAGSESIDDLAMVGDLLFALDAESPGHLSVFSLTDPRHPKVVGTANKVAVGPFSGVSAAEQVVMVSGGTSELSVFAYDTSGMLRGPLATADLGRGQPDIFVATNELAYASTHYWGPYFGINALRFDSSARVVTAIGKLPLDGAGFTAGGAKPASFPIDVAAFGTDTLLVAFARGVVIVSIQDPSSPRVLDLLTVGGKAVSIDTRGTSAAVAVAGPNAAIVFIEFGGSAPVIKRLPLPPGTNPAGIAFTGARVAVAARDRGVLLFDP
jgi:hypothetical protein